MSKMNSSLNISARPQWNASTIVGDTQSYQGDAYVVIRAGLKAKKSMELDVTKNKEQLMVRTPAMQLHSMLHPTHFSLSPCPSSSQTRRKSIPSVLDLPCSTEEPSSSDESADECPAMSPAAAPIVEDPSNWSSEVAAFLRSSDDVDGMALARSLFKKLSRHLPLVNLSELDIGGCLGEGGFAQVFAIGNKGLKNLGGERAVLKRFSDEASQYYALREVLSTLIASHCSPTSSSKIFAVVMGWSARGHKRIRGLAMSRLGRSLHSIHLDPLANQSPAQPRTWVAKFQARHRLKLVIRSRNHARVLSILGSLRDVARTAAASHSFGLIHSDLKGENILLDSKGQAVIVDYGCAGKADASGAYTTWTGTFMYAEPPLRGSIIRGIFPRPKGGLHTDVHAFGVMAVELLSGVDIHDTMGDNFGRDLSDDEMIVRMEEGIILMLMEAHGVVKLALGQSAVRVMRTLRDAISPDPGARPSMHLLHQVLDEALEQEAVMKERAMIPEATISVGVFSLAEIESRMMREAEDRDSAFQAERKGRGEAVIERLKTRKEARLHELAELSDEDDDKPFNGCNPWTEISLAVKKGINKLMRLFVKKAV